MLGLAPSAQTAFGSCPTHNAIIRSICRLAEDPENVSKLGPLSAAIYDAAWISIVRTQEPEQVPWMFPDCYSYLLDSQNKDGT